MKRILVTGATGNIGYEVIHYLKSFNSDSSIIAALRHMERGKKKFSDTSNLRFRFFDFEQQDTHAAAFNQIDVLFLLRPPHLSKIETVFRTLLEAAKANGVKHIVFLSVQGAEKSKMIPHHKIERLIQELKFNFIFIRPSYFMQNLTTALRPEIVTNKCITLPSGNAKFNWVDVKNIGEVSAKLILNFEDYQNKAYEITGMENKNFSEVTQIISEIIGEKVSYIKINPIRFYFKKRREGIANGFALVMTILHFIPRLQPEPKISDVYKKLTGKNPTTLREFVEREKTKITSG